MQCNEIIDILSAFIDGTLDSQTADEVEKHTATCHECRTELTALSRLVTAAQSSDMITPPVYLKNRILIACKMDRQVAEDRASDLIDGVSEDQGLVAAQESAESEWFTTIYESTREITEAANETAFVDPPSGLRESILAETVGATKRAGVFSGLSSFFAHSSVRWSVGVSAAAAVLAITLFTQPAQTPVKENETIVSQEKQAPAIATGPIATDKIIEEEVAALDTAVEQSPTNIVKGYVDAPKVAKKIKTASVTPPKSKTVTKIADSDFNNLVTELETSKKPSKIAQASEDNVSKSGINEIEVAADTSPDRNYEIKIGTKDTDQLIAAVSNRYNKEDELDKKLDRLAKRSAINSNTRKAEYNFVESSF